MVGSLAPLIAVRLLETYKYAVPIAWYLAAAVSAVAVLVAAETKGVDGPPSISPMLSGWPSSEMQRRSRLSRPGSQRAASSSAPEAFPPR